MPQQFINAQVERVAAEVATALAQQKAQPFNASLAATRAQEFRAAEAAREAARAALIEAHRALDGAGAALETARSEGRTGDLPALEAALAAAQVDVRAGQGRLAQA